MDGKANDLFSWKRKLLHALFRQQQTHELIHDLCKALGTSSREELQELVNAIVLSECAYKVLEMGEEAVASVVTSFLSQFPSQLVTLRSIQPSLKDLPQNYLLAEDPSTLYVAFMGTKRARDFVTDLNFVSEPIWVDGAELSPTDQIPTAHRGFLARSRAINIDQLHQLAVSSGKRLVLCGHSLGGAVATLCTLRLLRELQPLAPDVRCYCFATPAVGNSALAELVDMAGWHNHFFHYFLPEDQLMRVISLVRADPAVSARAEAIAAGSTSPDAAALEAMADAMSANTAAQADSELAETVLADPSPSSWDFAAALAGRRDWVLRKWQHIAGVAQRSATGVVPTYHAFGQQLYLYRSGVCEQDGVSAAELDMASEFVDGSKASGPFSFHRMKAYRTRFLLVLMDAISRSQHAHNFWSMVGLAGQLAQPVAVSRELFPAIAAHSASMQLPLLASSQQQPEAADSAADDAPAAADAAAAPPRRSMLPFMGRGRQGKPRVDPLLLVRVSGLNLQYCHYLSVRIFGQVYIPAGLAPAELARDDLTDPPPQQGFIPLRLISNTVQLARRAAGAVYHLASGSKGRLQMPQPERSELLLRVPLPAAVVARLAAAAAAGSETSRLVEVTLRSDFQQVAVPVEVRGHSVALLALTSELAAFVLAALTGTLALPAKAGPAQRQLPRWLPRPQWLSGLQGEQQQQQQQERAAAGFSKWAPVAAATAAAAAAALHGASGVMAQPLLPPAVQPPVGVIGRAAAASEGFVAATGRLVGLSRQLRATGRAAADAAAQQQQTGLIADAAAAEAPAAVPNARLAVGGAVRKIISFASKRKSSQQQEEEQAVGQQQQEEAVAGGELKRPKLLLAERSSSSSSMGDAGGSRSSMDVYSLSSSSPKHIYTSQPAGAAAAAAGDSHMQEAAPPASPAASQPSQLSKFSFSMRQAPPTKVQDPAGSSSSAAAAAAAAEDASESRPAVSSSGWRFGFPSLPQMSPVRMGTTPAALLPSPAAPAAAAAAEQQQPASAAAPSSSSTVHNTRSAGGVRYTDLAPAGTSWQQAAAEMAQQLQQQQQQQQQPGWKVLPVKVLHAAGALAKGITAMSLQPVTDALSSQQQQEQPQQQQQQPHVLLVVAHAGDQQQLQQLQQSPELQQLLPALAAAGIALLPVLLHDPQQQQEEEHSLQLQQAKHVMAAALDCQPHAVLLLPVQQQLLQGEQGELPEQQQRLLLEGVARLKQQLQQQLQQQTAHLVPAAQLAAKL